MRRYRHLCILPLIPLLVVLASRIESRPAMTLRAYTLRPIFRLGQRIGSLKTSKEGFGHVYRVTDDGRVLFEYSNLPPESIRALIQYAAGDLKPWFVAGPPNQAYASTGGWPENSFVAQEGTPESINASGSFVFDAPVPAGEPGRGSDPRGRLGVFCWDSGTRKLRPVALAGMPGVDRAAIWSATAPVINDRGEIAFAASLTDGRSGIFLAGRSGQARPVLLSGDPLPDGTHFRYAERVNLNDSGAITFLVMFPNGKGGSAYRWQNGTVNSLAEGTIGPGAPGGGTIDSGPTTRSNDANNQVLVDAELKPTESGIEALYLLTSGRLTPVAVPGQLMPGGGRFKSVQRGSVSDANRAGQDAFIADLQDGGTAAYRIEKDGKLALPLKNGMQTSLGQISVVGGVRTLGLGLNSRGQVAIPVQIGSGPDIIVLMTPFGSAAHRPAGK